MKSGEELQQRIYNAVLRRTTKGGYNILTLTLLNNNEVKIDPWLLLDCISASRVPLNNIKEIQARLLEISEKDWEAFYIQTLTGTELQVPSDHYFAPYSPRIYEMLQSSRLTQFR